MTSGPMTDQQLEQLKEIADRAVNDPLFVSDCEGSLQVWHEKALVRVHRDESGAIQSYSFPFSYKATDQVLEIELDSWDPGENAADDQRRQDVIDLVDARDAMPLAVAEIVRLRAELASRLPTGRR